MAKGEESQPGAGRRGAVTLACLAVLLAVPSCQDGHWADAVLTPAVGSRSVKYVQEGIVAVRAGEEVRVRYPKPFQSPPRLVLGEFSQSWFVDVPYKKSDLEIVQQEAVSFTINNRHGEQAKGSWAAIRWRAEGIGSGEKPVASTTRSEPIVARVEGLGGSVTRDARLPEKPVIGIDLHATKTKDADLELLQGLANLRTLNLYGTVITDAGLMQVTGLPGLRTLYLNDTAITDDGLQSLQRLTGLQELSLYHTRVTDDGLRSLGSMTGLQNLTLSGAGITDRGLQNLKRLRDLRQLVLCGTGVSVAGVEDLQRALPKVKILR